MVFVLRVLLIPVTGCDYVGGWVGHTVTRPHSTLYSLLWYQDWRTSGQTGQAINENIIRLTTARRQFLLFYKVIVQ